MDARTPVRRSGTPLTRRLRAGAAGLVTRPPAALRFVLLGLALVLMATAVLAPRPGESLGRAGADSVPTDGVPDPTVTPGAPGPADRTTIPGTPGAASADDDATLAPTPDRTSTGRNSGTMDTGAGPGRARQPSGGDPITPPSAVPAAATTAAVAPAATVPPAPARPWPSPGSGSTSGSTQAPAHRPPAEPAHPTTSVPPLPGLPIPPALPTPSLPAVPALPPLPEPEPPCVTPPLLGVRICTHG